MSRSFESSIGGVAQFALTASASSISSAQLVLALGATFAGASSSGGGARPNAVNAEQLDVKIEYLQDISPMVCWFENM